MEKNERGYVKKKTNVVEEKEQTIGTRVEEKSKVITGNLEDVAPLLRAEGFDIDTVKLKAGIEPTPVKTEETRKVLYTTASKGPNVSNKINNHPTLSMSPFCSSTFIPFMCYLR